VAENQPDAINKNRMISDLATFAARLREFITSSIHTGSGEREFNALALELFRLQFAHNATYERICVARQVRPDAVKHWFQIPAVPTSAFKEFDVSCLTSADRTTVFHSSGTTKQQPSRHFHNTESLAIYEASLWPWFAQHLLPDLKGRASNLRLVCLTPSPAQAPHSSLVWMLDSVRRQLNASETAFVGRITPSGKWTLNFEPALENLTVESGRKTQDAALLLIGTAFSFVHLLDRLEQMDLRFQLPSGSRVMETGGYKGRSRSLPKAELHAQITQRLGIPTSHIVCEYGMSELSSQAYGAVTGAPQRNAQHASRAFEFPPWARVQITSPETGREVADGEMGLIRVFDLANVFSVLAMQTEDLATRRGDQFELLGRATDAEVRGCSLMTA